MPPSDRPKFRVPPEYRRERDLPRLIALWPHEVDDLSIEGSTALVEKLRAALRRERSRGRAGHWTYDLNRHKALLGCYRAEVRRLAGLRVASGMVTGPSGDTMRVARPSVIPPSALAPRAETHFFREL